MSRAIAIGDGLELAGYALAGVHVSGASTDSEVLSAFEALPDDSTLIILTTNAHAVLVDRLEERSELVYTVLPS